MTRPTAEGRLARGRGLGCLALLRPLEHSKEAMSAVRGCVSEERARERQDGESRGAEADAGDPARRHTPWPRQGADLPRHAHGRQGLAVMAETEQRVQLLGREAEELGRVPDRVALEPG